MQSISRTRLSITTELQLIYTDYLFQTTKLVNLLDKYQACRRIFSLTLLPTVQMKRILSYVLIADKKLTRGTKFPTWF